MILKIAVDKDRADLMRIGFNPLWVYLREFVIQIFGPLTFYTAGKLLNDKYLKLCYIKEFADHRDELPALSRLKKILPSDLTFYSDFKNWVEIQKHYLDGTLGYYDEFKLLEQKVEGRPTVLLGRKGSGKTTLLYFAKDELERLQNAAYIFINLSSPSFASADPLQTVAIQIIHSIDDLILNLSKTKEISDSERIIKCLKRYWEQYAVYPSSSDTPQVLSHKQAKRDELLFQRLSTLKYSEEFIPYLRCCIIFLKEFLDKELTIIIDDVDRLEPEGTARAIFNRVNDLTVELKVQVFISVREETIAQLTDIPLPPRKIHVVPPSFVKVLKKRLEVFNAEFRMPLKSEQESGYDTETSQLFVNHIVQSILTDEVYANLIAYHYDLDILLDIVRCSISSPYLDPKFVLQLARDHKPIPWHLILNSMQLYVYRNFYDENSFILNVYDNDERPIDKITTANNLVRVRLLQVLRYLYTGIDKPVEVGKVYALMAELGYNERSVFQALQSFARQRLIVTALYRNAFSEDVDTIIVERTIIFYLSNLIYTYRYLQNIVPVTPVNFEVPCDIFFDTKPLIGDDLRIVDEVLERFIIFIRLAEEEEKKYIKNHILFDDITRKEKLSDIIERRINDEIGHMIIRKKAYKQK